jgi:hypothetical protein
MSENISYAEFSAIMRRIEKETKRGESMQIPQAVDMRFLLRRIDALEKENLALKKGEGPLETSHDGLLYRLSERDLERIVNEAPAGSDIGWAAKDLLCAHYELDDQRDRIAALETELQTAHQMSVMIDKQKSRIAELEEEVASAEKEQEGWRCFHCHEKFTTTGAAADHFGTFINSTPGCIMTVQLGGERGLLMELRRTQDENAHLRQQMDEEYWDREAFNAHLKTLIQSYRPFKPCSTLQDVFHIYDFMEGRALAAEEAAANERKKNQ